MNVKLDDVKQAQKLNLEVSIPGTDAANDWDLWVFPRDVPTEPAADILVTRELNDEAREAPHRGRQGPAASPACRRSATMSSIRSRWAFRASSGTRSGRTGSRRTRWASCATRSIRPSHSSRREYHSNWQWWELMHGTAPFILTAIATLQPVVQVIDDWVTARKLALVFEARVGKGKLLACSCDLVSDLDKRPGRPADASQPADLHGRHAVRPQVQHDGRTTGGTLEAAQPAAEARCDGLRETIIIQTTPLSWPSTTILPRSGTRTGSRWPSRRTI